MLTINYNKASQITGAYDEDKANGDQEYFIANPQAILSDFIHHQKLQLVGYRSSLQASGLQGVIQSHWIDAIVELEQSLKKKKPSGPDAKKKGSGLTGAVVRLTGDEKTAADANPLLHALFTLRDSAYMAAKVAAMFNSRQMQNFSINLRAVADVSRDMSRESKKRGLQFVDHDLVAHLVATRRSTVNDFSAVDDMEVITSYHNILNAWSDQVTSLSDAVDFMSVGEVVLLGTVMSVALDPRQLDSLLGTDINPEQARNLTNRIRGLYRLADTINRLAYAPFTIYVDLIVQYIKQHSEGIGFFVGHEDWIELAGQRLGDLDDINSITAGVAERIIAYFSEPITTFKRVGVPADLIPPAFAKELNTNADDKSLDLRKVTSEFMTDKLDQLFDTKGLVLATGEVRVNITVLPTGSVPFNHDYQIAIANTKEICAQLLTCINMLLARIKPFDQGQTAKSSMKYELKMRELLPSLRRTFLRTTAFGTSVHGGRPVAGLPIRNALSSNLMNINGVMIGSSIAAFQRARKMVSAADIAVKKIEKNGKLSKDDIPEEIMRAIAGHDVTCFIDAEYAAILQQLYGYSRLGENLLPASLLGHGTPLIAVDALEKDLARHAAGGRLRFNRLEVSFTSSETSAQLATALSGVGIFAICTNKKFKADGSNETLVPSDFYVVSGKGRPYGMEYSELLSLTKLYQPDKDAEITGYSFNKGAMTAEYIGQTRKAQNVTIGEKKGDLYFFAFRRIPMPTSTIIDDLARHYQPTHFLAGDIKESKPVFYVGMGLTFGHQALRPKFPTQAFYPKQVYDQYNTYLCDGQVVGLSHDIDSLPPTMDNNEYTPGLRLEEWKGPQAAPFSFITVLPNVITVISEETGVAAGDIVRQTFDDLMGSEKEAGKQASERAVKGEEAVIAAVEAIPGLDEQLRKDIIAALKKTNTASGDKTADESERGKSERKPKKEAEYQLPDGLSTDVPAEILKVKEGESLDEYTARIKAYRKENKLDDQPGDGK